MKPFSEVFLSEAFRQDPHPAYTAVRDTEPVYGMLFPDGQFGWMITGYDDGLAALKDLRFTKDYTRIAKDVTMSVFSRNMLFSDPPDHKRLRSLVQKAFTRQLIASMRDRIQQLADGLLDEVAGQSHIELVRDFAFPLPIIVICEMLGVPSDDRDQFRIWSNAMIEASALESLEPIQQYMGEFVDYLSRWFTKVRQDPQDDMISRLIAAEEQGDTLSEPELYGIVSLLIIAGHETTVNLIGNGALAFLDHPDQLMLLKNQPDLITNAIEEILRYNGPVEFSTSRWVLEDLEFRGKKMHRGDLVIISLNAADHDPRQFPTPDTFDITRKDNDHLAFGKGVHLCLGAPLARLEGEIALRTLFQRYPHLKLAVDRNALNWRPGMIVRGVKEIPLALQ